MRVKRPSVLLEMRSKEFVLPSLPSFHLAAAKGHVECLRVMVTHGVDVTAQDTAGMLLVISPHGPARESVSMGIHIHNKAIIH